MQRYNNKPTTSDKRVPTVDIHEDLPCMPTEKYFSHTKESPGLCTLNNGSLVVTYPTPPLQLAGLLI